MEGKFDNLLSASCPFRSFQRPQPWPTQVCNGPDCQPLSLPPSDKPLDTKELASDEEFGDLETPHSATATKDNPGQISMNIKQIWNDNKWMAAVCRSRDPTNMWPPCAVGLDLRTHVHWATDFGSQGRSSDRTPSSAWTFLDSFSCLHQRKSEIAFKIFESTDSTSIGVIRRQQATKQETQRPTSTSHYHY